MKNYYLLFISLILLLNCASQKLDRENAIRILENTITDKSFEIVSDWAQPLLTNSLSQISNMGLLPPGSNAGMINLIGNSNYVRIKGDTISGYLPYFGERQMGGGYGNTNGAIEFDNIPTDLIINKSKKNNYKIQFSIKDKNASTETYRISIEMYPSSYANIFVSSSQRFSIRYKGSFKDLNERSK